MVSEHLERQNLHEMPVNFAGTLGSPASILAVLSKYTNGLVLPKHLGDKAGIRRGISSPLPSNCQADVAAALHFGDCASPPSGNDAKRLGRKARSNNKGHTIKDLIVDFSLMGQAVQRIAVALDLETS